MFLFKKKKVTPEERRNKSNKKIKSLGITCYENLPVIEDSADVTVKSLDEICKRAIACLLSTQIACDIAENNNYNESKEMFTKFLKEFGVENCLLEKERRLFEGNYQNQDAIDVVWTYEAYWSLVWALGLVENIEYPYDVCDCERAIRLVGDCKNFEEFKKKCKLRNVEEILDMLDLHYRYHWATTEKRINPSASIGDLNPEVVLERRRGLEWLISPIEDWNDIALHT